MLPLVQRELLVTARRKATAWERAASAGVAFVVFAMFAAYSNLPPRRMGSELFGILTFLLFVECAFAGLRYTSDCLSEERRNGTLGLLFLTNLSALGVVLGKLISRSLGPAYNLVAALPVLSLCVMLGSVTGEQVAATAVALLATMCFSLAVGLWVSSHGSSNRNVIVATLGYLIGACAVPPAGWEVLRHYGGPSWLLWPSPAYLCLSAQGGFSPHVQGALVTVALLGLGVVAATAWRLHRNYREDGEQSLARRTLQISTATSLRRWLNANGNPILWLVARGRSYRPWILAFAVFVVIFGFAARYAIESKINRFIPVVLFGSYGLHAVYRLLITAEASRQLNADRRSGVLELLLTTPLQPVLLIQGHLKAVQQFWWPVLAGLAILNSAWMLASDIPKELRIMLPCTLVLLVLDSYALIWRALVVSLRGKSHPWTVSRAWGEVMVPPVCAMALVVLIMVQGGVSDGEFQTVVLMGTIVGSAYDLWLIKRSWVAMQNMRALAANARDSAT